ncbi:MAG TPA: hypothetical protein VN177_15080 [Myxococcales bacterium]|nr:hypothetical protein [Myxococcales bacterium]
MGASGWHYVALYQEDTTQALVDLQRALIASGDYYHGTPREELDDPDEPGWGTYYQFDGLVAARETDEFWEQGTHSILDIDRIIDAGQPDEAGAIALLPTDSTVRLLGSARPTRSDYERARPALLQNAEFPTWSGRCAVIYHDGQPHELAFNRAQPSPRPLVDSPACTRDLM